jgi:hypothetical protein
MLAAPGPELGFRANSGADTKWVKIQHQENMPAVSCIELKASFKLINDKLTATQTDE